MSRRQNRVRIEIRGVGRSEVNYSYLVSQTMANKIIRELEINENNKKKKRGEKREDRLSQHIHRAQREALDSTRFVTG